jgi:ABC-2 type transport system ATP-binding protein
VHSPELLVLDEPFAGLDPIVTDLLAAVLRDEADRGVPVLLSSHQLELIENICDSIAIIDRGRLVARGPVEELRAAVTASGEHEPTLGELFRELVTA